MENQYLDYASWKKTNNKLITYLLEKESKIIARFKYVLLVVDYLFDKAVNKKETLTLDEEEMFEIGYQYLFDRFNTITLINEHIFEYSYVKMEHYAKAINLLLYIDDFIDELDSLDGEHKTERDKFVDLEDKVMKYLENKIMVPDELYALTDDISFTVFNGLGIDYYGITDIFYDIAIELELISDSDDDYYDIFDNIN